MEKPSIVELKKRLLVGMQSRTSIENDTTANLWKRFKPRVKEIKHRSNNWFYSVQVYDHIFNMNDFTPQTQWHKWAAVEVDAFHTIPEGMEMLRLSRGKYAVFIHRGPVDTFHKTLDFIYRAWLPDSDFLPDKREHFEILGDRYLGIDNPDSEEEVWIPIKEKV